MQLSFMTWVCPTWDIDRIADFIDDTPYEGVEFRVDNDHAHGMEPDTPAEERQAVVDLFDERGIDVPAVATSEQFAYVDDEERAAQIESAKANAELAGDLGADVLRIFAGGDQDEMNDEAAAAAAEAFTEVGDYAADHGVTPLLETMHDIVESPEDAYAVLDQVESDNVGILWNRATISEADFAAIEDDLMHVHMHADVLEDDFDDTSLFSRCADIGYEGAFSLEIIRGEDLADEELRETGDRLQGLIEEVS